MPKTTNLNAARSGYALASLTAYQKAKGEKHPNNPGDLEAAASDLICDLMHFAASRKMDALHVLEVGQMHFLCEHGNREETRCPVDSARNHATD